jgi:hypothetical protein
MRNSLGVYSQLTGGGSFDSDAQAFITAAAISNSTQQNAINTLVLALKSASIWTKMKALYPFVGGTESSHKWNLKDPRDLDAAFRLTFPNGATHTANGVDWNGTSQYARTYLTPSTSLSATSGHLSYYSRTDEAAAAKQEIGCVSTPDNGIIIRFTGNLTYFIFGVFYPTVASSTSLGFYQVSRNTTNTEGYRNGVRTLNAVHSGSVGNVEIYIGARNNNNTTDRYTTKQCAFASIGDNLSESESSSFYNAVQAFQTSLSRQV